MNDAPHPLGGVTAPHPEAAAALILSLERCGVRCALGGSGLLAALGLADRMNDWDVTTDAPFATVVAALDGRAFTHKGADALHADEKLMLPDLGIEIIRGFAFHAPGGVVRLPTFVTARWHGLPVGSAECWAVAYDLLERDAKRDLLLGWLDRTGADAARLDALLAQPLPAATAERLRGVRRG